MPSPSVPPSPAPLSSRPARGWPAPLPDGRVAALGRQLVETHLWLRDELTRLREDVAAHLDGDAQGPPERPRELRAHCLAFCSALRDHHTGEDDGTFPAVAAAFPELVGVLDELRRDHHLVADVLRRVEGLAGSLDRSGGPDGAPEPAEARRVRGELDGLAALLESHLTYEERKLVAVLDAMGGGAG